MPATPWVLEEKLGAGGFGEVWLAPPPAVEGRPASSSSACAQTGVRALKREMTLFRVWRARAGDHPHLVQLLGVNLDRPPFYLEEEYDARPGSADVVRGAGRRSRKRAGRGAAGAGGAGGGRPGGGSRGRDRPSGHQAREHPGRPAGDRWLGCRDARGDGARRRRS
ncbi:MAG: hypothetical protein MZW92_42440 [Comamonadaceae bacterium]|nr:hypothetical protein [Comamonadaceae bacterium]